MHFQYFLFPALRDNRIELVRASWHELSISVSDVSLSDEGQYTCSLFTMPVKTSKAYLTVLGKCKGLTLWDHKLKQHDSTTNICSEDHINRYSLIPSLLHYNKRHLKTHLVTFPILEIDQGRCKDLYDFSRACSHLFLSQQQTPGFLIFNQIPLCHLYIVYMVNLL